MFFPRAVRTHRAAQTLVMACAVMFSASYLLASEPDPLWGAKMVDVQMVKFGSVAKGADVVALVRVKNVYQETIEIANLTTGCGCVAWDESRKSPVPFPILVPSGQTQVLHLRLNTIQYDGERKSKATITLFDRVHAGSEYSTRHVELPIEGYIRKDIVIEPGAVNFGAVDLGSTSARRVEIRYAGRPDWKLISAKVSSPHLAVALNEISRGGGLVNYELQVTLKPDAPVGNLRDQVTMVTDDLNNPETSILVEAKIEPDIVVNDVQFSSPLVPGTSQTRSVIVRGNKEFKIIELYREEKKDAKEAFKTAFKIKPLDKKSQTVHSLPITITAPDVPGAFEEDFFLEIQDRPQRIQFKVRGRISASPAGAAKD